MSTKKNSQDTSADVDPTVELGVDPTVELPVDPTVELGVDPTVELPVDPTVELGVDPGQEADPGTGNTLDLGADPTGSASAAPTEPLGTSLNLSDPGSEVPAFGTAPEPGVDPGPATATSSRPDLDSIFSLPGTAPTDYVPAAPAPDPVTTTVAEPVNSGVVSPGTEYSAELARRGEPRVGTIVWGFIFVAIGVAVLAHAAGLKLDPALVAVTILSLAGLTLIIGSLVTGARRRRRGGFR